MFNPFLPGTNLSVSGTFESVADSESIQKYIGRGKCVKCWKENLQWEKGLYEFLLKYLV